MPVVLASPGGGEIFFPFFGPLVIILADSILIMPRGWRELQRNYVTLSHLRSKGVSVVQLNVMYITTTGLQVCYNYPVVLNFPVECGTNSHCYNFH